LAVWLRSSADTSTPYFFANPAAAGVGDPSAANAAETGGPVTSSSKSVWRRAETLDRGRGRQSEVLEARFEMLANLCRQVRQPARGDLLAADLDEQLAIHQRPSAVAPAGSVAST
jgi:hypothetical protein